MRDWQALVATLSDVGKLVHLAMRQDAYDEDRLRGEILRERRRYYEAELTQQAARVGCSGRVGRLTNGAILSELNDASQADAASIVNTYNYDLAVAIAHIRAEVPTANRYVYSKRLREWEVKRAEWKNAQIQLHTQVSARTKAQQDFFKYNSNMGIAELTPKRAVCPVCQGWVERGWVPLYVAMNNPANFHVNCPHTWETKPDRVLPSECPRLWVGGE